MLRPHAHLPGPARHLACALAVIGCVAAVAPGCERAGPQNPGAPSGGETFVLDYDVFVSRIDPILTTHGCDNLNCHGGGIRGTFQLSPSDDNDLPFDFAQASLQVVPFDPSSSPLAMKPLAEECGGATHAGGASFTSLDDPDYMAILAWIEAGEYR